MTAPDSIVSRPNSAMTRETSTAGLAKQAEATVQARYLVARANPRDLLDVRVRLLGECKRPRFAGCAVYEKPIGNDKVVTGPSIRFAEAAARCLGNLWTQADVVYDDHEKRIIRVAVTDLEANTTFEVPALIEKTVERSVVPKGDAPISQRTNSRGKITYLLRANEDQVLAKGGVAISKAMRNCIIRLLPGDILDEAMEQVEATLNDPKAVDPAAERNRIADGFAKLNIRPSQVKEYLGHEIGSATPAELRSLRGLWTAISEGHTTWDEAMESRRGAEVQAPPIANQAETDAARAKVRDALANARTMDERGAIADSAIRLNLEAEYAAAGERIRSQAEARAKAEKK